MASMARMAGVTAAPNQAWIRATILRAEQSPQFADKWMLEIEISAAEPISGPQLALVGMRAQAFTIRPAWDLPLPAQVEAEAEYVGGPRLGAFRLKNLRAVQ
jgi:hypothetical protein